MKYNDYLKTKEENKNTFFFGENNLETSNKRFQIKNNVIDNDNILLITNNIQYFSNKECFVLWVGNDKIVYLKDWQVIPVYNFETIGYAYIVKLNRNYFKSYNCFKSDRFFFEKEETFDTLLDVAKQQTGNNLWFKKSYC